MPVNIQEPARQAPFSVFVLGFRPFFLAAALHAVLAMLLWLALYSNALSLPLQGLAPLHWHAHEMLFGFALAVVTGFLLTAIRNWTGIQTLQNRGLMLLLGLWLGARMVMLLDRQWLLLAALLDLAYNLFLLIALTRPIWRVRQWQQAGILSKVLLIGACNTLFYLGLAGVLSMGVYWGLYGALYLLIALIMTIGRRVMPGFIQNGVDYPVKLKNSKILDVVSLAVFVAFVFCDLILINVQWASYCAAALVLVSLLRLVNWHTVGIWRKPLLWGLYVAFMFITLGFALFALLPYTTLVSRSLALHAFTIGGIGLITLSMMSRVTLGHTGRDIQRPHAYTGLAQGAIVLGAVVRIFTPMIWPQHQVLSVLASQILWALGFAVFVIQYGAPLIRARIDGSYG